MNPPSVFIIAASADYQPAWRVHQQLSQDGEDCFLCDEAQLRAGEKGYLSRVEQALADAKRLVVVAGSPGRVKSQWVCHIWEQFLKKPGKARPFTTVRCGGMLTKDLPRPLRRGISLEFPAKLERLSGRLTHPEGKAGAAKSPATGRMRILAAVTILNVLMFGGGIWLFLHYQGNDSSSPGTRPVVANGSQNAMPPYPGDGRDSPHENTGPHADSTGKNTAGTAPPSPAAEDGTGDAAVLGTDAAPAQSVTETPAAGTPLYVSLENVSLAFSYIPPGTFSMGSPETEPDRHLDEPLHTVTLTQGLWLARTECTRALWESVMDAKPWHFNSDPNLPAEAISLTAVDGAGDSFLSRMNRLTLLPEGWAFALPSEAQWEYACRAGTATPFAFGSQITSAMANFDGLDPYDRSVSSPFPGRTTPVGHYAPNAWGLYDMHGNVEEYCADHYWHQLFPARDPLLTDGPDGRVLRGGSWRLHARACRSASRESVPENFPGNRSTGFRLAIVAVDSR